MGNTRRPALERRDTRAAKAARKADLDAGVSVVVDGETYTVTQGDMTSTLVRELRRETGFSFIGLMQEAARQPDIDIIAALVWLGRRQAGEHLLAFGDVELDYGVDIDLAEPEEDADPET